MAHEIIGHDRIRSQLRRAAAKGNLHSTLLFTGPDGIGKRAAAVELSEGLLCSDPQEGTTRIACGKCRSCTVIRSGNHPDFVVADFNEREKWRVESVRELLASIQVKPYLGHGRAVIFDNAHAISTAAANILLKSFEEPQRGNTFILVSSNPSKLPVTLRSRCQTWAFTPLSPEELAAALRAGGDGAGLPAELLSLSDGSVSNARLLLDQADLLADVKETLRRLRQGDAGYAYEDISGWAKDKSRIPGILHLSRMVAREHMLSAPADDERAAWAVFLENVNAADRLINERNLNPLLVLLNIFLRLIPGERGAGLDPRAFMEDTLDRMIKG